MIRKYTKCVSLYTRLTIATTSVLILYAQVPITKQRDCIISCAFLFPVMQVNALVWIFHSCLTRFYKGHHRRMICRKKRDVRLHPQLQLLPCQIGLKKRKTRERAQSVRALLFSSLQSRACTLWTASLLEDFITLCPIHWKLYNLDIYLTCRMKVWK